MLKICSLAALALLGGATLVAAQGPEHGKQGDGSRGPAAGPRPSPQRASPPPARAAPPPQRPAARAPQPPPAAAARAHEAQARTAAEQQRAAQQQRQTQERAARAAQQHQAQDRAAQQRRQAQEQARGEQERARTQQQAQERARAEQQRRAAEQERTRGAEQRNNERRQAAERQRAAEREAAERRRADEQRAVERRRAAERANPALRSGANQPIMARREQLRQERTRLSRDQHVRLRQAFPVSRERVTRVQFTKRIGTRIPRSVRLFAVPAAVLAIFPYYRDYRYVVEEDTICIVDPETYEIVDVLDEGTYAPGPRPQVAELILTDRERTLVLDSIPPDFPQVRLRIRLALGAEIPPSVELYEFAPLLLDQVPKLRGFRFVVSQEQLVIVEPQDRSTALVLDR
jgi:hypothetical protein